MVDCVLIVLSFACGVLAVTPFIWCFLFRSIFPSHVISVYNDTLYSWSIVGVQIAMVFLCFKKYSKTLSKCLDAICVLNILLIIMCLLCIKFPQSAHITIPVFFTINLILMSVWLPVTYEAVYLCNSCIHVYFQVGFYIGIMSYYLMLFYGSYTSSFLFVPLATFLPLGLHALRSLMHHHEFKSSLLDKKAIFISKENLYVTLRLGTVPALIGSELFLVFCVTVAFIIFLMTSGIYTEILKAFKFYLLIFYFGSFCSGGFCYPAHWLTLIYTIMGGVFITLVFVLESMKLQSLFFFGVFFCFINAINGEFSIMHKKLKKGINGPKIVLSIYLLVNIFVSVTINVLNRSLY